MPNKEMIFIDTANRKLHIHDKHGALHHSARLNGKPRDATPAGKTYISFAITVGTGLNYLIFPIVIM